METNNEAKHISPASDSLPSGAAPCSASFDGGPAFPIPNTYHPNGQIEYGANGLSVRDWFAGMALSGMMSNHAMIDTFSAHKTMAEEAYNLADRMIESRQQNAEPIRSGGGVTPSADRTPESP